MTSSNLGRSVAQTQPPDDGWRVGIVASVNPLVVTLQGAPVTLAGQLPVSVSVGDPVALARQDQSWLVVGSLLPAAAPADRNLTEGTTSALNATTTSASFGPIAGLAVAFTRYRPNSRLRIAISVSARPTGAGATVGAYAMEFTDAAGNSWLPTILPAAGFSTLDAVSGYSIERTLTPNTIGTGAITAQLLWRRVSGGGTLTIQANVDTNSITIEEV